MASFIAESMPVMEKAWPPGIEPSERLTTSAPWSAAHRMPSPMSSEEPEPASSTLTGRIFALGATPTTPTPLLRTAATVPAT